MAIQQWSEGIWLVDLADEPVFSEEMQAVMDRLDPRRAADVLLNFAQVRGLNSSNLSQLLRLRKKLITLDRRLRICCISDSIWGVMLVTGLDKVFEFSPDTSSALASLQLDQ